MNKKKKQFYDCRNPIVSYFSVEKLFNAPPLTQPLGLTCMWPRPILFCIDEKTMPWYHLHWRRIKWVGNPPFCTWKGGRRGWREGGRVFHLCEATILCSRGEDEREEGVRWLNSQHIAGKHKHCSRGNVVLVDAFFSIFFFFKYLVSKSRFLATLTTWTVCFADLSFRSFYTYIYI